MLQLLNNPRTPSNLSQQYDLFLNNQVYKDLELQFSLQELLNRLNSSDLACLKEEIASIPKRAFYDSYFHGISHIERTIFWTFFLAREYSLNEVDKRISLDAAKYHDIGRSGELEELSHGRLSAEQVGSFLTNPIYEEEENRKLLCASMELHSLDDSECLTMISKYDIKEIERFSILWRILKDADALDRVRLTQGLTRYSGLNPLYLRLPFSKSLIKASHELCTYCIDYEDEKDKETLLS